VATTQSAVSERDHSTLSLCHVSPCQSSPVAASERDICDKDDFSRASNVADECRLMPLSLNRF
jgi:hypothetical protein